jgi:rSAM/selenodomain-associated transferase 2
MTSVAIIIPTLNEESVLAATLQALPAELTKIVADGGSTDRTREIATEHGAVVVQTSPGRGGQMQAGAILTRAEVLWFLHADALPEAGALEAIQFSLADENVVGGHLQVRFQGADFRSRFMNWLYPRLAAMGLVYGDAGLFVRRDLFWQVGGFRGLPLFEDVELAQILRRHGQLVQLRETISVSNRRWKNRSFSLLFLRWIFIQTLFWLGVPPRILQRLYPPVR